MPKKMYVGVDNQARTVKKMYVGVDGFARKVIKAYVGVDGVAKLFFEDTSTQAQASQVSEQEQN